jgi:hypothetical protein
MIYCCCRSAGQGFVRDDWDRGALTGPSRFGFVRVADLNGIVFYRSPRSDRKLKKKERGDLGLICSGICGDNSGQKRKVHTGFRFSTTWSVGKNGK